MSLKREPDAHDELADQIARVAVAAERASVRRETVSPKANAVPAHVVATTDDIVRHPAHYTKGIECWDYITSHRLGFLEGNVIKYVTRYQHKNGLEDLLKARQYLERLIKEQGGTPLTEF